MRRSASVAMGPWGEGWGPFSGLNSVWVLSAKGVGWGLSNHFYRESLPIKG